MNHSDCTHRNTNAARRVCETQIELATPEKQALIAARQEKYRESNARLAENLFNDVAMLAELTGSARPVRWEI